MTEAASPQGPVVGVFRPSETFLGQCPYDNDCVAGQYIAGMTYRARAGSLLAKYAPIWAAAGRGAWQEIDR